MSTAFPAFFLRALEFVFTNEGGYVNDPMDPGRATNYGITQGTLATWLGHPVSADDVRRLTREQAAGIYNLRYWAPLGCNQLTQFTVACALFDTGVLFGIGTSAVAAQRALKERFPEIAVDGHIGPRTIAALNAVDPKDFLPAFHRQLLARIDVVIGARPESEKFRHGWVRRVDKLLTLSANT